MKSIHYWMQIFILFYNSDGKFFLLPALSYALYFLIVF